MLIFDGHCDTLMRCCETGERLDRNSGHLDLKRMEMYDGYAQFFAIFAEAGVPGDEPLWDTFHRQYGLFCREMERCGDRIAHCRTGKEARAAIQNRKAAAFLSVEGAEILNCDLDRLEQAWKMGVRAVNLTWNHPNALSGTNREEADRGLSARGRAFVRRMQELGMLVDVSHLSDPGFWDVMEIAEKPIFASHSNSRSVFCAQRNLTDRQFTAIIENCGVVGLNMYAGFLGEAPGIDTVVSHLEHFLALGGERTVALGGDWDGCDRLPEGIEGIQHVDRLWERLLRLNYPETLIQDIFYTNLMRVVNEVCIM